jgi:hypothetical protein
MEGHDATVVLGLAIGLALLLADRMGILHS